MLKTRKSMLRVVVMFCVVALTAFAGIAQAHEGGCGCEQGGRHHGHNFKKLARKLALTDAQKGQAKAIFAGNKEVMRPIVTNLHAERKNLHALMHADTIDEAAIRAETAKIAGIQADLNVDRAKARAKFYAILTPAQQAMLKKLHDKRHEKGCKETAPAE